MSTKFPKIALIALASISIVSLALTAIPRSANALRAWMPRDLQMNASTHWQGQPGGPGGMHCMGGYFNPAAIETLTGTVTQVNSYGGHQGVFVLLQTGQESLEVHLGPAWYLQNQGFEVTSNSPMEVTGFRSYYASNQPVVMASEVKQGDQVLQLRDANGYPLWMGQGMRPY